MIRDGLTGRYPRCHYNSRHRAKICFSCRDDADDYIRRNSMDGYISYGCPHCGMWHIGRRFL